jgi:hypothetical protein
MIPGNIGKQLGKYAQARAVSTEECWMGALAFSLRIHMMTLVAGGSNSVVMPIIGATLSTQS